jgi:membrane-associated phospholipid phosphatase
VSDAARRPRRALSMWRAATIILVAYELTALVAIGPTALVRWDHVAVARANSAVWSHHTQLALWRTTTDLGAPVTWQILAGVSVVVLWRRHRRRDVAVIVVAMGGAAVISTVVKAWTGRPRPVVAHPVFAAHGASYPSGHALTVTVALGLVIELIGTGLTRARRVVLTVACTLAIVTIGVSRIMLGVQYPSDVLGGWLVGAAWLTSVLLLRRHGPQ